MALRGYTKSTVCLPVNGGVREIRAFEASEIDTFTYDATTHTFTAVSVTTGAVAKNYEFKEDTAEFKIAKNGENGSVKFTNTIDFDIEKMDQECARSVQDLADKSYCGMVFFVQQQIDTTTQWWVVGYDPTNLKKRPVRLLGGEGTSGKKLDDGNMETVSLGNETPIRPILFTGTLPV